MQRTEPVVNPEVWDEVPDKHICPAKVLTKRVKHRSHDNQTQITQGDQFGILGLVQWAGEAEVVDTAKHAISLALSATFGLTSVVVVSSDIGNEVQQPSEELLKHHMDGSCDGCLLYEFGQFVNKVADSRCIDFARLGDEHHVTFDVSSGLVVLSVGDFP